MEGMLRHLSKKGLEFAMELQKLESWRIQLLLAFQLVFVFVDALCWFYANSKLIKSCLLTLNYLPYGT